ncbi:hypothetical protein HK101_010112 [Irineochytrium annulatum]|nr:hypothetical protein HK101_010112 [Irineochytrium annulatum]
MPGSFQYEYFEHRLQSFQPNAVTKKGWPVKTRRKDGPSPANLAGSGFHFSPSSSASDRVSCHHCSATVSSIASDSPHPNSIHYGASPDCPLMIIMVRGIAWAQAARARDGKAGEKKSRAKKDHVMAEPVVGDEPWGQAMTDAREKTFGSIWPHHGAKGWGCSAKKVAMAGFYHKPNPEEPDYAECIYCNLGLACWESDDDPTHEHRKRNPDCDFFRRPPAAETARSKEKAADPVPKGIPTEKKSKAAVSRDPPSVAAAAERPRPAARGMKPEAIEFDSDSDVDDDKDISVGNVEDISSDPRDKHVSADLSDGDQVESELDDEPSPVVVKKPRGRVAKVKIPVKPAATRKAPARDKQTARDAEKAERESLEREREAREAEEAAEQERKAAEEKERVKREKERAGREAAAKEAEARAIREADEKAAKERIAQEKATREAEEKARKEKAAREKSARETEEKAAREKAERERAAKEKAEREKLVKEKAERERVAREKAERERVAKETAERERIAREKIERDRAAREAEEVAVREKAVAKERAEKERAEQELALEKKEREEADSKKRARQDETARGRTKKTKEVEKGKPKKKPVVEPESEDEDEEDEEDDASVSQSQSHDPEPADEDEEEEEEEVVEAPRRGARRVATKTTAPAAPKKREPAKTRSKAAAAVPIAPPPRADRKRKATAKAIDNDSVEKTTKGFRAPKPPHVPDAPKQAPSAPSGPDTIEEFDNEKSVEAVAVEATAKSDVKKAILDDVDLEAEEDIEEEVKRPTKRVRAAADAQAERKEKSAEDRREPVPSAQVAGAEKKERYREPSPDGDTSVEVSMELDMDLDDPDVIDPVPQQAKAGVMAPAALVALKKEMDRRNSEETEKFVDAPEGFDDAEDLEDQENMVEATPKASGKTGGRIVRISESVEVFGDDDEDATAGKEAVVLDERSALQRRELESDQGRFRSLVERVSREGRRLARPAEGVAKEPAIEFGSEDVTSEEMEMTFADFLRKRSEEQQARVVGACKEMSKEVIFQSAKMRRRIIEALKETNRSEEDDGVSIEGEAEWRSRYLKEYVGSR